MKIISINGSPKSEKGNTNLILAPFTEGLREAGADVETLLVEKMALNPCKGDIHCWVRSPGVCHQDDDMKTILPKLSQADIWVFASPVYMDGISGSLKLVIDRMAPLVEPFMEIRDGHNRHVLRDELRRGKIVLVANSGFWELDNFDPMISFIKAQCRNYAREFAGALLRPHGQAMRFGPQDKIAEIKEAAREAGRQLVTRGVMSTDTLAIISQELLSLDNYVEHINQGFEEILRSRELRK